MIFTCPICANQCNVRWPPLYCCGVRHDADSPAIAEGELPARVRSQRSEVRGQKQRPAGIDCTHRGAKLRQAQCATCTGTELFVFKCNLHDCECSVGKKELGVRRCADCHDDTARATACEQGVPREPVGAAQHRDGWPWVVRELQISDCRLQIDDFVEQTFLYHTNSKPHTRPWAGIFHVPPDVPTWTSSRRDSIDSLFNQPAFIDSLPHLVAAFALSEHLAAALRSRLHCPVVALKYPQPTDVPQWSPSAFKSQIANSNSQILQLGWHLRNTRAIAQIPPTRFVHLRIRSGFRWTDGWDRQCQEYWSSVDGTLRVPSSAHGVCGLLSRAEHRGWQERLFLTPADYDRALTCDVALMEFFACSGSTALVECIARATPVLVNPHPAVVEYLGPDYPLYFTEPAEIPALVATDERIIAAHEYLRAMDRSWLDPSVFIGAINDTWSLSPKVTSPPGHARRA